MANTTVRLVLVGPRAGQTIVLNGREFINGICAVDGPIEGVAGACHYFARCYNAHPEGSKELRDAEAAYQAALAEENADGERPVETDADRDESAEVPGSGEPDGGGPDSASPDEQSGDADAETGSAGGVSGGDGHADTRVPPDPSIEFKARVADAVGQLDHGNDEHWTADGNPAVAAVAAIIGGNVTRQELDVIVPDVTRAKPKG